MQAALAACQHHCSTRATVKKARARLRNAVSLFIHPQEDKPRIYLAPFLLALAASPLQAEPASRIAAWSAAHGLYFVARFVLAPAPHIPDDIRPSSSTAITGKTHLTGEEVNEAPRASADRRSGGEGEVVRKEERTDTEQKRHTQIHG